MYDPNSYDQTGYAQNAYDPNADLANAAPAGPADDRRHRSLLLALLGAVAVLVLLSAGLLAALVSRGSAPEGRAIAATGTTPSSVAPALDAPADVPAAGEVPVVSLPDVAPVTPAGGGSAGTPGGSPSSGGGTGSGSPTPKPQSQPTTPPKPASPSPVITSFSTPPNIDCHNGNQQSFTASWSTQHATKVTISIDGPGVYKTYGPTGSDSLPFNCSSSHTFLLTAYGQDGKTVTKSITLQPRNVQQPAPADDEV